MADIPAPRIATRHLSLMSPRLAKLAPGATLKAMLCAIGEAFTMACVDPYASANRKPRKLPDEHLQGRDPDW